MRRRHFLALPAGAGVGAAASVPPEARQIHPGIWKITLGAPEKITPVSTRRYQPATAGLALLPPVEACPVPVSGLASRRGFRVTVPLAPGEVVYGLGLQLQSFIQRGLKKKLRVNADPVMDSGDTHAPVPFYVTTRGYGVLIDTARYATFYCGNKVRKSRRASQSLESGAVLAQNQLPAAYQQFRMSEPSEVLVEIPEAEGVDLYVFGGPTMRLAVQRYNLFSGGGPVPPRWGLGFWYRVESHFTQEQVLAIATEFRQRRIPCDVLGLEPSWQTHSYSCSFVWDRTFPNPGEMVKTLARDHYRLNLWEHAFTHPSSPIYDALYPLSGDYEVWGGLAPDFLLPEARRIFGGFHEKEHVSLGVAGYKLDECDNSDFTGNWSFPEIGRFPSGADGEQMHCLFGQRYQDAITSVFDSRKMRTYGLVRSSGALAAPYPYAVYSDLYDHPQFIRALVNSGFSGLLWTPELRDARDSEDLVRRLQTVVMSPVALLNAWYIRNPPWKQVKRSANNAGQFDPGWEETEDRCRKLIELRMRLLPYLHAAFVRYHREGLPPFRALVMDHPDDPQTWSVDNQYMMGESILVAPVIAGQQERSVYLPQGEWFDYWTGKRHSGKQRIQVRPALEEIPFFVKEGTLLPLADPTPHTGDPASWRLTILVYGNYAASARLYEDDGSFEPTLSEVQLSWDPKRRAGSVKRLGGVAGPRYEVTRWALVE